MALLEDEPTYTGRKLLLIGFPALLIAVAISLVAHQEAHRVGLSTFCSGTTGFATPVRSLGGIENGQLTTLGLGVLSFALLLRYPRNLFFISMAFVNATARLPETITVFLQYLIHNGTSLRVDESVSLTLFGLTDPTIPTVIMCFYSLVLLFFAIIVVHDVRSVRYKWPIAFALFAFMGYIEYGVMWAIAPIVTG